MKRHLLVVDDEKSILDIISKVFEAEDTTVACASNGEEAMAYLQGHDVDIVITDIMMPKVSGIELFYKMRKVDPFIQIIIITGYPSIKHIAEMLEAGACDFVIKPFDLTKLKTIVNETFSRIERWRALRKEWQEYRKKA